MWHFYIDIGRRMGAAVKTAFYGVEAFLGVALFVGGIFAPEISGYIGTWADIHRGWAIVPLALVFGHLFLKALYEKYRDMEHVKDGQVGDLNWHLSRVEGEFTEYRIAREKEVKELEIRQGSVISDLQVKLAELEERIFCPLVAVLYEKATRDPQLRRVFIGVSNKSPLAASGVSVLLDTVEIVKTEDANAALPIVDRLAGVRIRPRIGGDYDHTANVPGGSKKEFFFLELSTESGGIGVVNEFCVVHVVLSEAADEVIQYQIGWLPRGVYRFNIVVSADGTGTLSRSFVVSSDEKQFAISDG